MILDRINEKYFISFILISLFAAGCLALTRSLWVDEAMIFVNIKEINFSDIFNPLPYYTQASPVVPLAFHKLLYYIFGSNFFAIRLFSLVISVLSVLVFIYNLPKYISKTTWLIALLTATYSFLLYSTEMKHYIFEFIGSLFLINSYFFYISKSYLKGFTFSIIGITLGFSNIIPMGIVAGFILLLNLQSKNSDTKYLKYFLLSLIALAFSYYYMKYLTLIQIESHKVYLSSGIIIDTIRLMYSALDAHGKALTLLAAFSLIFGISKFNKNKYFKNFAFLYLFIILAVYILKLTALYPVISGRHLIWLVPFSITLCGMFLQNISLRLNTTKFRNTIIIFSIIIISAFFIRQSSKYSTNSENTANNKLIKNINTLCKQDNVNLISTEWADRVLNAYKDKLVDSCDIAILKPLVEAPYKESFIKKLNLYNKNSNNFLILSHLDINREYDHVKLGNDYYKYNEYIISKGLRYTVYFYDKQVAILALEQ